MADKFDVASMRFRVTLQVRPSGEPVPEAGGAGDEDIEWLNVDSTASDLKFAASIIPLVGRELVRAQSVRSTTSHRVRMRVVAPIFSDQARLLVDNGGTVRVFNLDSVTRELELNGYYDMLATETRGEIA